MFFSVGDGLVQEGKTWLVGQIWLMKPCDEAYGSLDQPYTLAYALHTACDMWVGPGALCSTGSNQHAIGSPCPVLALAPVYAVHEAGLAACATYQTGVQPGHMLLLAHWVELVLQTA